MYSSKLSLCLNLRKRNIVIWSTHGSKQNWNLCMVLLLGKDSISDKKLYEEMCIMSSGIAS